MTPEVAERAVQAELDPEETVIWIGRPGALALAAKQAFGGAVLLVWTGLATFGLLISLASDDAGLLVLVPAAFVAIGVLLFTRLVRDAAAAWWTVYAITDRRILVLQTAPFTKVMSWTPRQITSIERRDSGAGRGDVVFHQTLHPGTESSVLLASAFVDVAGVREVEKLVRKLAAG